MFPFYYSTVTYGNQVTSLHPYMDYRTLLREEGCILQDLQVQGWVKGSTVL